MIKYLPLLLSFNTIASTVELKTHELGGYKGFQLSNNYTIGNTGLFTSVAKLDWEYQDVERDIYKVGINHTAKLNSINIQVGANGVQNKVGGFDGFNNFSVSNNGNELNIKASCNIDKLTFDAKYESNTYQSYDEKVYTFGVQYNYGDYGFRIQSRDGVTELGVGYRY